MINVNKVTCCITGKVIPPERAEALEFLGIPPHKWTVIEASVEQRKKAAVCGENWDFIVVNSLGEKLRKDEDEIAGE